MLIHDRDLHEFEVGGHRSVSGIFKSYSCTSADPDAPRALYPGRVTTRWFFVTVPQQPEFEAEFEEPRSLEALASEQREFLQGIDGSMVDIVLPMDD